MHIGYVCERVARINVQMLDSLSIIKAMTISANTAWAPRTARRRVVARVISMSVVARDIFVCCVYCEI